MTSKTIIIGEREGECPIKDVVKAIKFSGAFALLVKSLPEIALSLDVDMVTIDKIKQDMLLNKTSSSEALYEILLNWVGFRGREATLSELISTLNKHGLKKCSESLENAIVNKEPSNFIPSKRTYFRLPSGLQNFIDGSSNKSVLLLSTLDVNLTCDKIRELLPNCPIHSYEDFLDNLQSNIINCAVKDCSFDTIKEILYDSLELKYYQVQKLILVTIVSLTELDNILEGSLGWKEQVSVAYGDMELADLSPRKKFRVGEKIREWIGIKLDPEECLKMLHGKVLVDVLNDKKPEVFKKTLPKPLPYYIKRTITTRHIISNDIFKMKVEDVFLFTGVKNKYELSNLVRDHCTDHSTSQIYALTVRFIVLDEPHQDHFKRICGKAKAPVHWIEKWEDGKWKWRISRGGISTLQNCLGKEQEDLEEEAFCAGLDAKGNEPVCISDSPGKGKSELLAEIGRRLTEKYSERNVFFLELPELLKEIKKTGSENKDGIVENLQKLVCANELGERVLLDKLEKDNISVELLIDGFDEIDNREVLLALNTLKIIRFEMGAIRLWITSRPHFLHELEDNLNTLGYKIQPFTRDNQQNFLIRFWSSQSDRKTHKKLTNFAEKCLDSLNAKFSSGDCDIAGVPLQCFMIGEVYKSAALDFLQSNAEAEIISAVEFQSISHLYELLIEKKLEKYKLMNGLSSKEIKTSELMQMHVQLSISLLFPANLNKVDKMFPSLNMDDILQVGIVESCNSILSPKFLHRTFAEYLVAKQLYIWLSDEEDSGKSKEFSEFIIEVALSTHECKSDEWQKTPFKFENQVVCYFLNSIVNDKKRISENSSVINLYKAQATFPRSIFLRISMACAAHNFFEILKFLDILKAFKEQEKLIYNKFLPLISIQRGAKELFKFTLEKWEAVGRPDAKMKLNCLRLAVEIGVFPVVELLINEKGLRSELEGKSLVYFANNAPLLLHNCVQGTSSLSKEVAEEKGEIVKALAGINSVLLKQRDEAERVPLHMYGLHIGVLVPLLEKSDIFAMDECNHIFLHQIENFSKESFSIIRNILGKVKMRDLLIAKDKDGYTPMAKLIELTEPDLTLLQSLKSLGADFNSETRSNLKSVLELAIVYFRSVPVLRKLVDCGASPKRVLDNGENLVHVAAKWWNAEAVEFLVDELKLDVNALDNRGRTPLDYAIHSIFGKDNCLVTCETLKRLGGNFSLNEELKLCPFIIKYSNFENLKCLPFLLENGLNPNEADENGGTVLHHVMREVGLASFEFITKLLDLGANPNAQNNQGETPLEIGIKWKSLNWATYNLLKSRMEIRWSKDITNAILELVIRDGRRERVDPTLLFLLPNQSFSRQESPLNDEEFKSIISECKEKGGDFCQVDLAGNTLLHWATQNSDMLAIKLILENGGNVNLEDGKLLDIAADHLNLELTRFFMGRGNDQWKPTISKNSNTFLHEIISRPHSPNKFHEIVELLVSLKCTSVFNVKAGSRNWTPFHLAVFTSLPEYKSLEILKENGVDFNAVDENGDSVLFYAIVNPKQSLKLVSDLVMLGAKTAHQNNKGRGILHVATWLLSEIPVSSEMFKFVLSLGTNLNEIDDEGNTPTHFAISQSSKIIKKGMIEKLRMLIEAGADVNIPNGKGHTPLSLLLQQNNGEWARAEVAELLGCDQVQYEMIVNSIEKYNYEKLTKIKKVTELDRLKMQSRGEL